MSPSDDAARHDPPLALSPGDRPAVESSDVLAHLLPSARDGRDRAGESPLPAGLTVGHTGGGATPGGSADEEPAPAAAPDGPAGDGREPAATPAGADGPTYPRMLGRYRLTRELGRGGMGAVHAAVHVNLNKQVAVKVILSEFADSPRAVARFRKEALAVGDLSHPNVVAATDADEADGCQFLVMELVDGLDLGTLLVRSGPLPPAEACEVVRQAAVGLQYVHERDRVHRDLKPSNLMLAADGTVKILDLGLAALRADGPSGAGLTGSNLIMGTPDYMAPEQWADIRAVDIRADIYSLGCTLHHLITGHPPFADAGGSPSHKRRAHAERPFPAARPGGPAVPAAVDAVLRRMVAKDPADRFARPRDVADHLAPLAAGADCVALLAAARSPAAVPLAAQTGSYPPRRSAPAGGRRPWRVAAAAAVVAAAGVITWAASRGGPTADAATDPAGRGGGAVADVGPQPNVWFDALQREPDRLFWNTPRPNQFYEYNPGRREVRVDVPGVSLLGFGRTDHPGYRIQLGIHQTGWVGGVGLFWGYRDVTEPGGPPRFRTQVLELKPRSDRNPKDGFTIQRSWAVVEDTPLGWEVVSQNWFKAANFPPPTERRQHILAVDVSGLRLTEVRWDGIPFPDLVGGAVEAAARLGPADYVGQFGAFSRKSHAVFGNAQLLLRERPSP